MSKKNKYKNYNKDEPKFHHGGFPLESIGELNFLYWAEELKENGFIKEIKRGKSYLLCEGLTNSYMVQLKTKAKTATQNILMPHSYTSDFTLVWEPKGAELFCNKFGEKWVKPFICDENLVSHLENKPGFDFANMSRLAKINVKFVWSKYKEFVQITVNDEIFQKTFVPKILLNTKHGKKRVFKWNPRSLEEYVKLQNK